MKPTSLYRWRLSPLSGKISMNPTDLNVMANPSRCSFGTTSFRMRSGLFIPVGTRRMRRLISSSACTGSANDGGVHSDHPLTDIHADAKNCLKLCVERRKRKGEPGALSYLVTASPVLRLLKHCQTGPYVDEDPQTKISSPEHYI